MRWFCRAVPQVGVLDDGEDGFAFAEWLSRFDVLADDDPVAVDELVAVLSSGVLAQRQEHAVFLDEVLGILQVHANDVWHDRDLGDGGFDRSRRRGGLRHGIGCGGRRRGLDDRDFDFDWSLGHDRRCIPRQLQELKPRAARQVTG